MIEMRYAEIKATRVVLTLKNNGRSAAKPQDGTFNDRNSSTFNMVMVRSNPYRNIRQQKCVFNA